MLVPINERETMADLMHALDLAGADRGAVDARHHQPHAADDRSAAPPRCCASRAWSWLAIRTTRTALAIEKYGAAEVIAADAALRSADAWRARGAGRRRTSIRSGVLFGCLR